MKPKTTHLFIDLDGTLLTSDNFTLKVNFVRHCASYLKKEYGLGFLESFYLVHQMRVATETGNAEIRNELRAGNVFSKKFSISEEEGLRRVRAMVISVFPKLSAHFRPIPGALEFIQWASSRYHLTLATNPVWPRVIVINRLGWAGIEENYFKMITNAETMHFCKPDVGYYRQLLDQTKVESGSVLMIGDNVKKDLPAWKLGIPVFILKGKEFSQHHEGFMTGNFAALRQYLEKSR